MSEAIIVNGNFKSLKRTWVSIFNICCSSFSMTFSNIFASHIPLSNKVETIAVTIDGFKCIKHLPNNLRNFKPILPKIPRFFCALAIKSSTSKLSMKFFISSTEAPAEIIAANIEPAEVPANSVKQTPFSNADSYAPMKATALHPPP